LHSIIFAAWRLPWNSSPFQILPWRPSPFQILPWNSSPFQNLPWHHSKTRYLGGLARPCFTSWTKRKSLALMVCSRSSLNIVSGHGAVSLSSASCGKIYRIVIGSPFSVCFVLWEQIRQNRERVTTGTRTLGCPSSITHHSTGVNLPSIRSCFDGLHRHPLRAGTACASKCGTISPAITSPFAARPRIYCSLTPTASAASCRFNFNARCLICE